MFYFIQLKEHIIPKGKENIARKKCPSNANLEFCLKIYNHIKLGS